MKSYCPSCFNSSPLSIPLNLSARQRSDSCYLLDVFLKLLDVEDPVELWEVRVYVIFKFVYSQKLGKVLSKGSQILLKKDFCQFLRLVALISVSKPDISEFENSFLQEFLVVTLMNEYLWGNHSFQFVAFTKDI